MNFDSKEAGARFKEISRILGYTREVMADSLGVSLRQISYLFKNMSHKNALMISRKLGLPIAVFYSNNTLENLEDIGLIKESNFAEKTERRFAIFDGSNTQLLVKFLNENEDFINSECKVFIQGFNNEEIFMPKNITASFDGYKRSIFINESLSVGGENAVLEDVRLKDIRIEVKEYSKSIIRKIRMPFLVGGGYNIGAKHAISLYEASNPLDALACCSLSPDSANFKIIIKILEEYSDDIEVCESCFDNVKTYKRYFVSNPKDGIHMFYKCMDYIKKYFREESRYISISFAIEAIPFCISSNRQEWNKATIFLKKVQNNAGLINHAQDIQMAAEAAIRFLPFASSPSEMKN